MKPSVITLLLAFTIAISASALDARHRRMTGPFLVAAYERSESDANAKYQGERVWVGGAVESVGRSGDGAPYIVVWPRVLCRFPEKLSHEVIQRRPTTGIGVNGTVVGIENGFIVLKDCALAMTTADENRDSLRHP